MIARRPLSTLSIRVLAAAAATLAVATGCDRSPAPPPSPPTPIASDPEQAAEPLRAVIDTDKGTVVIEFLEGAPRTVANFCLLASKGFYDGQPFYGRSTVVRQMGRPTPGFTPGYDLPREFVPGAWFDQGGRVAATLVTDADSSPAHGSGFFITVKAQDRWNLVYPIFANVIEGLDVVQSIQDGDRIRTVTLEGDPQPLWVQYPREVAQWSAAIERIGSIPEPVDRPR